MAYLDQHSAEGSFLQPNYFIYSISLSTQEQGCQAKKALKIGKFSKKRHQKDTIGNSIKIKSTRNKSAGL